MSSRTRSERLCNEAAETLRLVRENPLAITACLPDWCSGIDTAAYLRSCERLAEAAYRRAEEILRHPPVETERDSLHIIALGGGSASGKSHLARRIADSFNPGFAAVLSVDNYYLPMERPYSEAEKADVCFEGPESLDFSLLAEHLRQLRARREIAVPVYDFVSSTRVNFSSLRPPKILILEGYLALHDADVLHEIDHAVFLESNLSLCLERRIQRDTLERGSTVESVHHRWERFVYPKYWECCRPTSIFADLVIDTSVAGIVENIITSLLQQHQK